MGNKEIMENPNPNNFSSIDKTQKPSLYRSKFFVAGTAGVVVVALLSIWVFTGGPFQQSGKVPEGAWDVIIRADGFSPSAFLIEKGDTLNWVNEDTQDHWPVSTGDYPEFDAQGPIAPGQRWSFTFDRVGGWSYHDRLNPGITGVIDVSE